ncbi:MAG: glycosyltransferase family 1 protein [Thermoplasmatales archaeon]|nr:MAG: glycosyltransferase family 1 protein [Thermoplasmatales archaeon]
MSRPSKKPLIGFFPLFYNLAETGRAILVAKRYIELGGKAVFFSHGGKYEYLAKDFGYDIVRVNPIYTEESIRKIIRINRGEQKGIPYSEAFLREAVTEEIAFFKKTGVKMIVSFVNFPCSISARAAGIPLVCISPAPGNFHLRIPDDFENNFTRLIPQSIKIPLYNWIFKYSKKFLKPFNIIAEEFGLKPFKNTMDVVYGDVTLGTNFLEFINVFSDQQLFPNEDYVGIISLKEVFSERFSKEKAKAIEHDIKQHLNKSERSILLTMGSSGDKRLFLNILRGLNKTNHRIIAVYTNILNEDELPIINENILLMKFVPSIEKLHNMVDLTIMHGGQGTVYAAAYAGKPVIGFPMQFEQHLNLEKMVGHGVGFILSKKYFKEKHLLNAIKEIFNNYDTYLKNAQILAKKLPQPEGDKNTANRLVKLLQNAED